MLPTFVTRDLLWLTLAVAIACAWFTDRFRLALEVSRLQNRHASYLEHPSDVQSLAIVIALWLSWLLVFSGLMVWLGTRSDN